jgi:hypothetical protein
VDEVVVIDPVERSEGEGDRVDTEGGEYGVKTGDAILMRNLELQHHDGDDDSDDAVREGFEAGRAGDVVGHR